MDLPLSMMVYLISERAHRIVDPADATLRLLAFDPVTTATTLTARVRRLLQQNQLLSAVYVGYPDGQFLLLRPLRHDYLRQKLGAPSQAAFMVQSMAQTQILTAPYVFFMTQEVGVTLSQPSEEGRAVLGLAVLMIELVCLRPK